MSEEEQRVQFHDSSDGDDDAGVELQPVLPPSPMHRSSSGASPMISSRPSSASTPPTLVTGSGEASDDSDSERSHTHPTTPTSPQRAKRLTRQETPGHNNPSSFATAATDDDASDSPSASLTSQPTRVPIPTSPTPNKTPLVSALKRSSRPNSASSQRKGVHFAPGSGGSNDSDSGLDRINTSFSSRPTRTDEDAKSDTNSAHTPSSSTDGASSPDDIRLRGIPPEHHYIYRLLDPDDAEITFTHVITHPEIWTDDMLDHIVTYILPHDLIGLVLKGLRAGGAPLERNVTISFRNLSYTDGSGRLRLQGITGYLRPKMMMCVLGGQDAGITTFLDVLAQRQKGGEVSGELLCDGLPYTRGLSRSLGYVTKSDTNLPTMTVRETLAFSAALRQPQARPKMLNMRVEMSLKFLNLMHVADSIVGNDRLPGISSGERRRLSYACEIMAGHACVLADLPTKGLGSASAFRTMQTIQKGCMAGRSVACSMVQPTPEVFKLFSHLLVLSKGAQIYFGPTTQVELYFGHHGFKRPKGKEMAHFLEELSTTPGKFYVGQPPPPVQYLQRSSRDPDAEKSMVDIDSLQATAARYVSNGDYRWSKLTDEDVQMFHCSKDDSVLKAVMEGSAHTDTHQAPTKTLSKAGSGNASAVRTLHSRASFRDPSSAAAPAKKMRGLTTKFKSFTLPEKEQFEVLFDVMDELVEEERALCLSSQQSAADGTPRDEEEDARLRQHLMQRKWVWMVQCYRRSPVYDRIGQLMFSVMLQPRGEPIPYMGDTSASRRRSRDYKYHSTFWQQLYLVTWRQWVITIRNPAFTKGAFFRNVLIGLLVGSLFYDIGTSDSDARTRFGLFYFCMTFCSLSVVQIIPQIIEQRGVHYHQVASGYFNGLTNYLAFMLTSVPLALVEIFLFLIFVYPMSNLRHGVGSEQFFYAWIILLTLNMTTRAWMIFIGSISRTLLFAQALAPISLTLMHLFCGFFVPTRSIPVGWRWIHYLSPFSYSLRGLIVNEIYGLEFECTSGIGLLPLTTDSRYDVAPPLGFGGRRTCMLSDSSDIMSLYDMDVSSENDKWFCLLWLMLFFIGFNIFAVVAMIFVDHSARDTSELPSWEPADSRDSNATVHTAAHSKPSAERPPQTVEQHTIRIPKRLTGRHSSIQPPEAYLSFNDLSFTICVPRPKGEPVPPGESRRWKVRQLLTNVFGFATPKNMVALMGPSGAGRSTLLKVLAGKKTGGLITGEILINGRPRDISFTHIAGYVEKYDSHECTQTIREAVEFSAMLRLDDTVSESVRRERVDDALEAMQLTHVQHHIIGTVDTGGISPELRKRTTIAVELVMAPSMLFIDEPTTGLDSAAALSVMQAVGRLAQNISIICTIDQPSTEIVSLFNSVLVLSQGELAYLGPILPDGSSRGVVEFFQDEELFRDHIDRNHPAPFRIDKNRGEFAVESVRAMAADLNEDGVPRARPSDVFLQTEEASEIKRTIAEGLVADGDQHKFRTYTRAESRSLLTQFWVLLMRQVRGDLRNGLMVRRRIVAPTIVSLLLGTLYFQLGFSQLDVQNRISLMFLIVVFLCFSAQAFLAPIFTFRPTFFRELESRMYTPAAYWAAKFLADLPLVCAEVLIYSAILYWIAGLTAADTGDRWGYFMLAIFGTRLTAIAFCQCVARFISDLPVATGLITILNILLMLFSGFLIQKDAMPIGWRWMHYVSFFRYPFSFLSANELRDESFYCLDRELQYAPTSAAPTPYTCTGADDSYCLPVCAIQTGTQLLDQYSIQSTSYERSIYLGVIFVFAAGFQILNYIAMRFVNHVVR